MFLFDPPAAVAVPAVVYRLSRCLISGGVFSGCWVVTALENNRHRDLDQ